MNALSARLAALAAGQHALITLDQPVALKVTRHQREHLLASRQIVRVAKDVYRLNGAPATWQSLKDAIARLLVNAGLPKPALQHQVLTPGGRYRIVVAYPDFRIGIEGKSRKDHLTDEAFEADPVRDANLAIAGWLMVHITWAQLQNDPAGVVRRIRRAFESRGSLGR